MIPTPTDPASLIGRPVDGDKFGIDMPIGRIVGYEPVKGDISGRQMIVTAELFERTRALVLERMQMAGARPA